jgi:hypothetical protein
MNTPVLTPEQWREWREIGEVYLPDPNSPSGGRYLFASRTVLKPHRAFNVARNGVHFLVNPTFPNEQRAAIALLLDALAQAGEPLVMRDAVESVEFVTDSMQGYAVSNSGWLSDDENRDIARANALAECLKSVLPPANL